MSRLTKVFVLSVSSVVTLAASVVSAEAATPVKSVIHVHETQVESGICAFDVTFRLSGYFKNVDYYDNSGFLYRSIDTVGGGGPFRVDATAHGTTLTMQNDSFSTVVTYNRDGSVATYTERGLVNKFTAPGEDTVLLDAGIASFTEPSEEVLFIAGPHQAVNGDFDEFCAAFG
ncbi:MAG: hypothetical protein ACJ76P_06045 [Actinomycetota bacterium]